MENFSYHVPFYVVTGGVATSGHSSDLVGGKVGLFDRSTFSVATAIGNGTEFFFAQGNLGGKDYYAQSLDGTSHKSAFFYGKDVTNMYLSKPQRIVNEEWVIGFNGSPSSVGLSYKTGEPTRFKVLFTGNPAYRFFGGPKEYVVSYTPPEDCTEPCQGSDCPDQIVDCLTHTQKLIDNINNHTELRKFGVTAKLVTNTFSETTPNMTKWCITICDNGDGVALNAIKAQAPTGVVVTRTARVGSLSTYQFCAEDAVTPDDFLQTGAVLQSVCNECPSGSFLIGAKDVFIVTRPIVGGEDFSTVSSRDAYANGIWSEYASQESVTTSTTTTSTTTAAGSINADATFVGYGGGVATVKLKFPEGTVLDPVIGTDQIVFAATEPAVCVFDAPEAISWENCGEGIRSERTLKIKNINRPDCDEEGDRIDDLEVALAGVVGIQLNTLTLVAGTACKDDYTVKQWSVDCLDEGCLTSNVTFTYDDLPSFENEAWEVVPEAGEEDDTRKCGIRITAGYTDPRFGNCSFDPTDYYETEPVKFELSLLGEDWDKCDFASRPTVSQSRIGQQSRQSGEYVVREVIMKTDAYQKHIAQYSADVRMREAFDMNLLNMVDRSAFYDLYYVTFKASYGNSYRKNEQEKFTAVFAFKEGDASALTFQSQVLDVLTAKSGVAMHIHPANVGGSSGMQGIA